MQAQPETHERPGREPSPVLPDYTGACIANVCAPLLDRTLPSPSWVPAAAAEAAQVVLLVLDGLGWEQLRARPDVAPFLNGMDGGPITSVAPTTTATALTSITTGCAPARHEVLGYRVRVHEDEVLNVLRWRTAAGDALESVVPVAFQRQPVFAGTAPVVVTRAEFGPTGFTLAHLTGVRLEGWRVGSSVPVLAAQALQAGEGFVYAYYDGIDKVAHERGFGDFYDAELRQTDALVADLAARLPRGAALVVTADHGQVQVGTRTVPIGVEVMAHTALVSGEGRFRWLHARAGVAEELRQAAAAQFGAMAWVRTIDELVEQGWYGGPLTAAGRRRLGDVAVIPHEPVAVVDPADTGDYVLQCRHGSATAAEMLVPLLAVAS